MAKVFNVTADCKPNQHYMVDISNKLEKIKEMVDQGQYFTINRARQYGKTTTLRALERILNKDYIVVSLDFQMLSYADFHNEQAFTAAFSGELLDNVERMPEEIQRSLCGFVDGSARNATLSSLFKVLSAWCRNEKTPIVLMIDEVDSAANNQVFLDFLAQLRGYYIRRDVKATFQSVILAGVYDIKNIRGKIRQEYEHKRNSPWNIAADFNVDMSFSKSEIEGMLQEYEKDYHIGMECDKIAGLLYDYTSGYPFLVSRLCKLIDERVAGSLDFPDKKSAWTKAGFLESVKMLLGERNTLFESLVNKLTDYPDLRKILYMLLFTGKEVPYNPLNKEIESAEMFGFIKKSGGSAVISNRIFEIVLYNLFLSEDVVGSKVYDIGQQEKNQFIIDGHLNMKRILEKFVIHFDELYGDRDEAFFEDVGRRYFLLYLKPIINGTGNYYVEAETRNRERTDVIVDYHGEQFIIEMKIWRGDAYHTRGEQQLADYLEYYHLKKGYMLSFCFNRNKKIGVREITLGDKVLIEAVV